MPQITQIQVRRDTAANWTSVNPKLAQGEIGFEYDTGKFKIGNGTNFWNDSALTYVTDASDITGTTLPASITSASGLATVGTITSGTWNGGVIGTTYGGTGATTAALARTALSAAASGANSDITSLTGLTTPLSAAQGGTGFGYGTALVGRAVLAADKTKPNNNTTPEAVFYDSAGTTIQYINLEADTTYSFDGYIGVTKDATSALPNARILYYSTGTTTTTPQAISCFALTRTNTAVLGGIDITAANTTVSSGGTANTAANFHWQFSGVIRTNATTGGRFTIAVSTAQTLGSALSFKAGSYLNVVKIGSGNAVTFGNWSA